MAGRGEVTWAEGGRLLARVLYSFGNSNKGRAKPGNMRRVSGREVGGGTCP